jgi:hypothetical protein
MSKTSTISVQLSVIGDGVSDLYTPPGYPIVNNSAPTGIPVPIVLALGDNTIAVPTGTQAFLLQPPTGSVVTKKLKGVGGDTGFLINPSLPLIVPVPTGTTSILINASAGETVQIAWL